MLQEIRSNRDKIISFIALGEGLMNYSDLRAQGVCAKYIAIMAAGHVEIITQRNLFEYSRRRSDEVISKFVLSTIQWENSLNCEKIKRILDKFDGALKDLVFSRMDEESKEAIDSLKNLRDILAHGGDNGVSLGTVKRYFQAVDKYATAMHEVLLA